MTDVTAPPAGRPVRPPGTERRPDSEAGPGRRRVGFTGPARYLAAGGLYLATSVGLWWHVWTGGPSAVMTCACTDAGRMVWYLEWSKFALVHGHSLLWSNWMFHPAGFNLLSDTGAPAIALVMSPVTLLFGPVAAMNVASTLAPALTAFTMFWLLQRWVRWTPAAFVGGLAYGFSAAVIVPVAFGWLNLASLALLPLMVACFDELVIRQHARPARVGVVLAVLVTVEYFVSTEMVLITTVSALVAAVVLVGYAGLRHRDELRRRGRHALIGIATAVGLTSILLAYPVWFVLAGPAHLSGMVWSTNVPGNLGNTIGNLWNRFGQWGPIGSGGLARAAVALGGYRGPPTPSPSYLGPGMLLVMVGGALVWRSDRRLWFFGALGVATFALSLRVGGGQTGPWAAVTHLPLFDNVVQSRFAAVFVLCAAVMVAIVVDRTRSDTQSWLTRRRNGARRQEARVRLRPATGSVRWASTAAAGVVTLVALGPVAAALSPNLPLVVQPVSVPHWFLTAAEHLPSGQVVLTYPFATADSQASIPWQAIGGMHYAMAGGGGPAGTVARAGRNEVGFSVLRQASVPLLTTPSLSPANLEAVRDAMRHWGVTTVVVPVDTGLPPYQTARGTGYGVAFFTTVLGSEPTDQDQAWVWSKVGHDPAPVTITPSAFAACVEQGTAGGSSGSGAVARCVLDQSSGSAAGDLEPGRP